MKPKRLDIFLLLFSLFLCFSLFEVNAQNKPLKKNTAKNKLLKRPKIISGGVMNGRSVDLVKPAFPASAEFVNAKGIVSIQVLIDEKGNVIGAKPLKGHPLLIPASLKAALKSKFFPCIIANKPLQFSGVIVYKYLSDKMNWLEIGFNFDISNVYKALPPDFVEEKLMLIQAENRSVAEREQIHDSVENLIKSRISNDEKQTWLFTLGRSLKELTINHWDAEKKRTLLGQIETQLSQLPSGVSPDLVKNLEELKRNDRNEFNYKLLNIIEKLNFW